MLVHSDGHYAVASQEYVSPAAFDGWAFTPVTWTCEPQLAVRLEPQFRLANRAHQILRLVTLFDWSLVRSIWVVILPSLERRERLDHAKTARTDSARFSRSLRSGLAYTIEQCVG